MYLSHVLFLLKFLTDMFSHQKRKTKLLASVLVGTVVLLHFSASCFKAFTISSSQRKKGDKNEENETKALD